MPTIDINYWAVLVAAIVGMAIGAVWYSVLFGKKWMELMNLDEKKMEVLKEKAKWSYVWGFLTLLVMAYVLAHIVDYAEAATWLDGLQAGFWIWLGFVATVMLGGVLWEGKPFKLYLIGAAHELVSLLVMGVILAVWV